MLNSLNTGKLKKEMQMINVSEDACKLSQFLCQSCSVQLVYSADAMW